MRDDPAPVRQPNARQTTAAVVILCAIWGSSWLVIKDGLDVVPPLLSAGLRFAVAGLVMIGVCAALREREGGVAPPTWLWVVVGTTNFAMSYGVIYYVEQILPSGLVSVLWAAYPLFMAVCGHLFLVGERLRSTHWLGFALGFLGVVLLFENDLAALGSRGRVAAVVLLASPVLSALGTTLLKRYGAEVSSLALNRNAMLLGALELLVASQLLSETGPALWSNRAIAGVLYLGVFGTVVTLGLYYWLLRYTPASRMSLIAYVTPLIALFLGWALAGEPVMWTTIVGAIAIIGGVGFAARPMDESVSI